MPQSEPAHPTAVSVRHEIAKGSDATSLIGSMSVSIPASAERVLDNALSWEHYPHVHSSWFASAKLIEEKQSGWLVDMAFVESMEAVRTEVDVDVDGRAWRTRIHAGPGDGTEVRATVVPTGENSSELHLDFHMPSETASESEFYLEVLADFYLRLYRESVAMMVNSQQGHEETERIANEDHTIGHAEVELPLPQGPDSLPVLVEAFGKGWRILNGPVGPIAHAARCPYHLLSLANAAVSDNTVTCPWHGYRFALSTGECLNGDKVHMPVPPRVELHGDKMRLFAPTS